MRSAFKYRSFDLIQLVFLWSARLKTSITSIQRPNLFQSAERAHQTETTDAARQAVIDQLETVLRLNPNHTGATELLGVEHERRGDLSAAMEHLERLFLTQPERARPKLVRVLLQLAEADIGTARATRWLDRVLELEPDHADARRARKSLHPLRRHFEKGRAIRGLTAAMVLLAAGTLLSLAIRPTAPPPMSAQALSNRTVSTPAARATSGIPDSVVPTPAAPTPTATPTGPTTDPPGEQTAPPPEPAAEPTALPSAQTPSESKPPTALDRKAPRSARPGASAPVPPTRTRRPTPPKPSASDALVQKGWTALEAGALSEAQALFDAAVRSSPRDPDAHYSLAYTAGSWASWTLLRPITARRFAMPHREVSCTGTYRPGCCSWLRLRLTAEAYCVNRKRRVVHAPPVCCTTMVW